MYHRKSFHSKNGLPSFPNVWSQSKSERRLGSLSFSESELVRMSAFTPRFKRVDIPRWVTRFHWSKKHLSSSRPNDYCNCFCSRARGLIRIPEYLNYALPSSNKYYDWADDLKLHIEWVIALAFLTHCTPFRVPSTIRVCIFTYITMNVNTLPGDICPRWTKMGTDQLQPTNYLLARTHGCWARKNSIFSGSPVDFSICLNSLLVMSSFAYLGITYSTP